MRFAGWSSPGKRIDEKFVLLTFDEEFPCARVIVLLP